MKSVLGTVKHHNTIESVFYGIKWAHTTAGLSDQCEADIVRSIVEASTRELNRPIKKKEPLTCNVRLNVLNFRNSNFIKSAVSGSFFLT
jgi:hypothetical protein